MGPAARPCPACWLDNGQSRGCPSSQLTHVHPQRWREELEVCWGHGADLGPLPSQPAALRRDTWPLPAAFAHLLGEVSDPLCRRLEACDCGLRRSLFRCCHKTPQTVVLINHPSLFPTALEAPAARGIAPLWVTYPCCAPQDRGRRGLFYEGTNPLHESPPLGLMTPQRPHLLTPSPWTLGRQGAFQGTEAFGPQQPTLDGRGSYPVSPPSPLFKTMDRTKWADVGLGQVGAGVETPGVRGEHEGTALPRAGSVGPRQAGTLRRAPRPKHRNAGCSGASCGGSTRARAQEQGPDSDGGSLGRAGGRRWPTRQQGQTPEVVYPKDSECLQRGPLSRRRWQDHVPAPPRTCQVSQVWRCRAARPPGEWFSGLHTATPPEGAARKTGGLCRQDACGTSLQHPLQQSREASCHPPQQTGR